MSRHLLNVFFCTKICVNPLNAHQSLFCKQRRSGCGCSWIPTCAKLFWEKREHWEHLVPAEDTDSTELAQEFFACVAAVMSFQLRGMVTNSLADFLEFFQIHKVLQCIASLSSSAFSAGALALFCTGACGMCILRQLLLCRPDHCLCVHQNPTRHSLCN